MEDFTFTNLNDNPNAIDVTVETDCGMQKVLTQNKIKKTTTTIVNISVFGRCIFMHFPINCQKFLWNCIFQQNKNYLLNTKQFLRKWYSSNYGSYSSNWHWTSRQEFNRLYYKEFSFLSQNVTITRSLTKPADRKHTMNLIINVMVCCRPTGTDLVGQLEIKWQSLVSKILVVVHFSQVGSMEVTLQ